MSATRVVVLHDPVPADAPPDALDTLVQVEAVGGALAALGFRVESMALPVPADALLPALGGRRPLVFNLVESVSGEGRFAHLAPLLLESAGVACTGNDSTALLLSSNKVVAKSILQANGLPTPPWRAPGFAGGAERGPWIVKSVWEHASIGLAPDSVVDDLRQAVAVARARAQRHGGEWFAEHYVDGREFSVALLAGARGPEVLAVAEMRFEDFAPGEPRIVDYAAKWDTGSAVFARTRPTLDRDPADAALHARIAELALACWRAFGLGGYARVDLRVDARGEPFILEVNANPCLSPGAGFALAAAHRGLSYEQLIGRIVADASAISRPRRAA